MDVDKKSRAQYLMGLSEGTTKGMKIGQSVGLRFAERMLRQIAADHTRVVGTREIVEVANTLAELAKDVERG